MTDGNETDVLKAKIDRLEIKLGDLERRVRQSWAKQGEANKHFARDIAHHVHPTYITGPTGEPLFPDGEA